MARYNATFTSVWDGDLLINARCYVSKPKRLILRVGKNDACDGVEEDLDILEEEYVTLDTGEKYTAMSQESYDSLLEEYENEIELQNVYGIVMVYQ